MTLPSDLTQLLRPRALRRSKGWLLKTQLGYQYRYCVRGLLEIIKRHGFNHKTLVYLEDDATQTAISNHVPREWKIDIIDILDNGKTPERNTYWKYCAANQMKHAISGEKHQTLPKALLCIAAVDWALLQKGINWDANTDKSVFIVPSLYWVVGFDRSYYSGKWTNNKHDLYSAYRRCGLKYAPNPNDIYRTLSNMADGQTSTYYTAVRLKRYVRPDFLGPVLMVNSGSDVPKAAPEHFLT